MAEKEPEQFSIVTALDQQGKGKDQKGAKKKAKVDVGKKVNDAGVAGGKPGAVKVEGDGVKDKNGKGKGKGSAHKERRLNDPEEDRRLAEQNGVVYIDQGSTRIDLDTGETVLTEPLVPLPFSWDILKPDFTVVLFGRVSLLKPELFFDPFEKVFVVL